MTEAKPICIIYLPEFIGAGGQRISWSNCRDIQEAQEKDKPEYYWFVIPDYDGGKIEFKVFYDKDFTEIQFAELKEMINKAIENQVNTKQ